ncbi:MAG: cyclodeaminase/cyclohydrolase family protein [Solirubrobacteraceae bacterium]
MPRIGEQTISGFLASLAAREPAPGGGAAAALHAAQGAALVAMVARYSDRGEDAAAKALAAQITAGADALLERATALIQADIDAFSAVAAAYGLPKDSDDEKAARRVAIAAASIGAAQPPADVIETAASVLALCDELLPVANRNVITDVAAAADAARAAAATARVNVEINLGSISDQAAKERFAQRVQGVDELLARADAISTEVRAGL